MAQQGDWIPPPPSNDVLDVLNLDAVHQFQFPPHKRHRNRPSANAGYSSTDRDRYRIEFEWKKNLIYERALIFEKNHLTNPGKKQGGIKMKNWARTRPKIKFSKNVPKIFLQMAPDLCYYGRIMIGGHWGSVERLQYLTANKPLIFLWGQKS